MRTRAFALLACLALATVATGCGDDDGNGDETSGSTSASCTEAQELYDDADVSGDWMVLSDVAGDGTEATATVENAYARDEGDEDAVATFVYRKVDGSWRIHDVVDDPVEPGSSTLAGEDEAEIEETTRRWMDDQDCDLITDDFRANPVLGP